MLTQRLGNSLQKQTEYVDALIGKIKAHPGSCNEVWLSTDYGYPSIEEHKASAEVLESIAQKFRKQGIRVSLQLSNSIGHGSYMASRDCSGLVYEGSPVEKMVGHDGKTADYCFCWNGAYFRKYIIEQVKLYLGKIKPYTLWIDDDLRASNHDPVSFGCFCDDCMRRFNERYGCNFTREELVEEINFGDLSWRKKHIEFIRDSLAEFTYEISKAANDVSPKTRIGLQGCPHGGYSGFGYDFLYDAMFKATGIAPASRPGGGFYNDHSPELFVLKGEVISYQNYMLPDYVTETRPEIENLPDVVYGKSIGGTCFETSYYFAIGSTGMSYAMLMNDNESLSWHEKMLENFSKHSKYWKKISECNKRSSQSGLNFALPKTAFLAENKELFDYNKEYYSEANSLRFVNIPIAFSKKNDGVTLLHPDNARCMSNEEIISLLKKPVITDGETVEIFHKRGFNCGTCAEPINVAAKSEVLCEHPVNGVSSGRMWSGAFGTTTEQALVNLCVDAEIISRYTHASKNGTVVEDNVASAIVTTEFGAKWAVFGFDLWNRTKSSFKRDQLLDAAEYISGHRQMAELITPIQAIVLPRVDKNGKLVCVSLVNCTVGDSGPLETILKSPVSEDVLFMSQYQKPEKLSFEKLEDNRYRIIVPNLKPWSVGTIFFE